MNTISQANWQGDVRTISSRDDVSLATRIWKAKAPVYKTPVFCLSGIDKNSRDFQPLAVALSEQNERDVYATDFRGHGLSASTKPKGDYTLQKDADDLIDVITGLGLEHAHIVATGYGGLVALTLSTARPGFVKSITLNDAGPAIDGESLARLQYRLQRNQNHASWDEAIKTISTMRAARFPAWGHDDWSFSVHADHKETNGSIAPDLADDFIKYIKNLDLSAGLGTLWPAFKGLAQVPMLAIRGSLSAGLSAATFEQMQKERTNKNAHFEALIVEGQGNAPLLHTADLLKQIVEFHRTVDS